MFKWKHILVLLNRFEFHKAYLYWSFVGKEKLDVQEDDLGVYYPDID